MRNIIILFKGNINYKSRVQKEIDTLSYLGFKIKLVIWSYEPIFYKKEGVEVVDINLSNHRVPRNASLTFFKIVIFWYLSAKKIKEGNYNYIHCNDLETLGVLFFLPKKYRNRVIYDAHELFPEKFSISSIRYTVWNILEKILIKKQIYLEKENAKKWLPNLFPNIFAELAIFVLQNNH